MTSIPLKWYLGIVSQIIQTIGFNDDQQIIFFLETKDNFSDLYFEGSDSSSCEFIAKIDTIFSEEFL